MEPLKSFEDYSSFFSTAHELDVCGILPASPTGVRGELQVRGPRFFEMFLEVHHSGAPRYDAVASAQSYGPAGTDARCCLRKTCDAFRVLQRTILPDDRGFAICVLWAFNLNVYWPLIQRKKLRAVRGTDAVLVEMGRERRWLALT